MYSGLNKRRIKIFFFQQYKLLICILIPCFFLITGSSGQIKTSCNEITAAMGFTVRSVKVNARWVPKNLQQRVEQLIGIGQLYDPAKLSAAIELVRTELVKNEGRVEFQICKGATSVLYVSADACAVTGNSSNKEIAIVIRPYYLRIDLISIGNNILPVPRSAKPTFYEQVPVLLKATAPFVLLTNDRKYGAAIGINTSTDILHFKGVKEKGKGSGSLQIDLGLSVKKSWINPFYEFGSTIEINHPVYLDSTIGWNLGFNYSSYLQPLGKGNNLNQLFSFRGGIQGSTKNTIINKYAIGAGFRFLQSRYSLPSAISFNTDEKGFDFFAMADGRPGKSFSRMGIWFDAGFPDTKTGFKNYQRLMSRVGYSTFIGSGHNNVHLETILGAGYIWGSPPANSQFFAGNTNRNFLYESISSIRNSIKMEGPVIQSLGEKEGGLISPAGNLVGGTSYWHININFSIPVSKWAKPLIPDVIISESPRVTTLRTALKAQTETAKNFIYYDLVDNYHYPDNDETDAKAEKIIDRDVRPALNYLADRANVYSIKPLLLFDIGGINDRSIPGKTWIAAGLGLQITLVVARLEIGYMHTIAPSADATKGNFLFRFVLQNFY